MNVLIIGTNTKMAKVFSLLPALVFILKYQNTESRHANELNDYSIIDSITNERLNNIFIRLRELRKIVRDTHYDVIFTNTRNSMIEVFFATLFLRYHPILLSTSHNSYAWQTNSDIPSFKVNTHQFEKSNKNEKLKKKIKILLMAKIINIFTDGFISLASFLTDILIKNGVDEKRIFTTTNSIESNSFKQKRSYELSNSIPHLLYVSVIYEGKGHSELIDAIFILKSNGILTKLTIIGDIIDEMYYKDLIKKVNELEIEDSIQFLGKTPYTKIIQLLPEYDIYVCPSYMEMSPYNVLEAKAAGLPIIATSVGGVPDMINDGVDGILIKSKNKQLIVDKIQLLLDNLELRKEIGTNAIKSIQIYHSPQKIADQLKTYLQMIKN